MKAKTHKKIPWFDRLELAGTILQLLIGMLILFALAVMATRLGAVWTVLF